MIDTDARLTEILTTIKAAVAASGIDDAASVLVTDDGHDVEVRSNLNAGAIVVYTMPAVEWPAPKVTRVSWTIGVVALIPGAPRPNSVRVGLLTKILRDSGLIKAGDRGAPTDFKLGEPSAPTIVPGYTITHTEENYS